MESKNALLNLSIHTLLWFNGQSFSFNMSYLQYYYGISTLKFNSIGNIMLLFIVWLAIIFIAWSIVRINYKKED
jgi:hypothetical protein